MPSDQSPLPFPFLALAPELRDAIYQHAITWPDLTKTFNHIGHNAEATSSVAQHDSKRLPLCTFPIPYFGPLSSPSLLLVNQKISAEALEVLYAKTFLLDSPLPYLTQLARPMDITEFISDMTLRKLRFVVLKMDLNYDPRFSGGNAKPWLKTLEILLDIWSAQNSLERLEIRTAYVEPSRKAGWTFGEAAHHRYVMGILSRLRGFGDQAPVVFAGDVPLERMKRRYPSQ